MSSVENSSLKAHGFPIGPCTVGPVIWREGTMRSINDNNKIINRSENVVKLGQGVDPLPHIRYRDFVFLSAPNRFFSNYFVSKLTVTLSVILRDLTSLSSQNN